MFCFLSVFPHVCLFAIWAVHTYTLPISLRIPNPNYSSASQRPSFEHAGLTWYTLLSPSVTFLHCFILSLNLPFKKTLSSILLCFCLSDWSHGSRPFNGLTCSSVLCFSCIFSVLEIPMCSKQTWPALWSTFRPTIKYYWSIRFNDVTA